MSFIRKHLRSIGLSACCLAIGAGAGVVGTAGASNAPSAQKSARTHHRRSLARLAHRTVQGDVILHTKGGFATVNFNRGTVDSVSGQQLTITEGTPKATYKTVTLTIPATARVRDNGNSSTLAKLTKGQRVMVLTAPHREIVRAHTPKQG